MQYVPAPGMKIPSLDHRDRDYVKTFHPNFGASVPPVFPAEYDSDAGLWMPNQNTTNDEFPASPPEPFGCTNFSQSDLGSDLDGILHNPEVMELLTHANANGGYDIRQSLLVAKQLKLITGFYNVQAYAPLDYFDAIRLASFSGIPEKRSVSVGSPWFLEWSATAFGIRAIKNSDGSYTTEPSANDKKSVMPMPQSLDWTGLTWHNWAVKGWKTINGSPYLKAKTWMGKNVGLDGGWLFFDRPTINAVMNIKYAIAFTATHATPQSVYTIDMKKFDMLMSYLKTMLGLRY